jgi:hypothetical protein
MKEIKKFQTSVIETMIRSYSSYFNRKMTEAEEIDCKLTIALLRKEIDSRSPIINLLPTALPKDAA